MKKNIMTKIARVLTDRREWLPGLLRGQILFYFTRFFRAVIPFPKNIKLEKNVRVQWVLSLLAEQPHAQIEVGENTVIYENAMIESYGTGLIKIGKNSVIGDNRIYSRGKIILGDRLVTSWNVMLQDFDPHPIDPDLRGRQIQNLTGQFVPKFDGAERSTPDMIDFDFSIGEIIIGNDVWLGANTTILKGAQIGNGCIVAAGAVVTKGVYPDRSILAGNPARIVKTV